MNKKGRAKKILFFLLLLVTINPFSAQTLSIFGKVVEENDSSAIGAAVILLNASDSSIVKGLTTNPRGGFKIEELNPGNYLLKISYIGYANVFKTIQLTDNLRIGKIKLSTSTNILKEVEVKTTAVIATQNGDTTNYNSNAFKTNKDAMAEDLLTKMPGVTIVDGKIQAQGEEVKQILVDGKPFFGDDPNSVLKNLPAEIIDKVQVFDRKSDQAQFTGFDDGNNSKTINITTKVQFRNGVFGRYYAGGGYQDKYKAGAVINSFKEKRKITFMGLSNNINEQNFTSEDLLGVVSSSGNNNRGPRGGGRSNSGGNFRQNSTDNFLVDIKNGITTTHAFGINYSDDWSKNISVTSSYFFNYTQNNAESNLLRQFIIGSNNGLTYLDTSIAKSININHRFNLRIDYKIDSLNSVIFQPKLSFQTNDGNSGLSGYNINEKLIGETQNKHLSYLTGYNISAPILYRHSFLKKGRTLSVNLNPSINANNGNSNLLSINNYYSDTLTTFDTIDQKSRLIKSGYSSYGNITFTEAFGKKHFISLNISNTYNYSESDKNAFSKNNIANDYSIRDSIVSNNFNNTYIANLAGISYRFNQEKTTLSFGVNAQEAYLNKNQFFPSAYSSGRVFTSILPNGMFMYRFNKQNNFRMFYRSSNNPPSIDQMQDVLNNSNTLQLSIGNPDLKQNFQHNLNIRFSGVSTLKSTASFVLLSGTYTDNYIGNSTIIANNDTVVFSKIFLAKGSQLSRPENLNNYYTLRFFANYSFPAKILKSNINLSAGCNYNNIPALINNELNYSNTTSPNFGAVISSNFSEKIDFTISSNTSYNSVVNSLQKNLNSNFINQSSKAKINLTIAKKLVLQAEYNHILNGGLSSTFNQNISLLNAAVAFKFLKDNKGELRLFAFDILNQNRSIQRNVTETYIEDTRTTILQRYFMLTFTYNFKNYFKKEEGEKGK